jgi:hypothetical protein
MTAIRLEQPIGIFYDCTHILKENRDMFITRLAGIFEVYFNITFFTDFVPGFLTNSEGVTLLATKPNFTFVIFLNYNHKDPRQRSLLNEFIKNKHEYILFSPYEMDLVAYVPYLYLQINLNDLNFLFVIINYLMTYLNMHINKKYHNMKKKFGDSLVNFTYLYLICLLSDKKRLKKQIYKTINSKEDRVSIINEQSLVGILLRDSSIKKYYYQIFNNAQEEFVKENAESLLLLYKELFTKFHLSLLHKYYPEEAKKKLKFLELLKKESEIEQERLKDLELLKSKLLSYDVYKDNRNMDAVRKQKIKDKKEKKKEEQRISFFKTNFEKFKNLYLENNKKKNINNLKNKKK